MKQNYYEFFGISNNASQDEIEKPAIKQVILEELQRYDEILDTKKDILIGAYNDEYDLKGYYSIITEFLETSKQYIQDLQEFKNSAHKYDLVEQVNQLDEAIEKLQKEINDTPLSLIDAQAYIEKEIFLAKLSEKYEQIELEKKYLARRWNYLCEEFYNNSIDAKKFEVAVNEILTDVNELIDFCRELEKNIDKFKIKSWKIKIRQIIDEMSIILKIGDNTHNVYKYGQNFYLEKKIEHFFNDLTTILEESFPLDIQLRNVSYDNKFVNQVENIDKLLENNMEAIYNFAKNDLEYIGYLEFIEQLYGFEYNIWEDINAQYILREDEKIVGEKNSSFPCLTIEDEINRFKRYRLNGNANIDEKLTSASARKEEIVILSKLYINLWVYRKELIGVFQYNAEKKITVLENYQLKLKNLFLIKSFFQITLTAIGTGFIFLGFKSYLQNIPDINTFALSTISGIGVWMINITPGIIYNNYCDEKKQQLQELQDFVKSYNNSPLKDKRIPSPLKRKWR